MKRIPLIDTRNLRQKLCDALFRPTVYGAHRRRTLLPLLQEWQNTRDGRGVIVNARHCAVMRNDPDLQYFVDHGIAKLVRIPEPFNCNCSHTYLVIK